MTSRTVIAILLIAATGLLAYFNTFTVPFQFDDVSNIERNPIVKDLRYFTDLPGLSRLEKSGLYYVPYRSRYVGYLSFALNYYFHGLDVAGYHITNLVIHCINALLVYWIVALTFRTPFFRTRNSGLDARGIALFSALLFVAHPVQTQAVTYIVQRFTSLAALFYLLSLALYVRWRTVSFPAPDAGPETHRLRSALWYLASLISAVLAMKTKETAFTLPVAIALYELLFCEGNPRRRLLFVTPFLLTLLIIPLTLVGVDRPLGALLNDMGDKTALMGPLTRGEYLATQLRVIVTYLRLLVLPVGQNLDYDYPVFRTFIAPEVLLSLLLHLALIGAAVFLWLRSRRTTPLLRLPAFGVFWFYLTLSVESSIVPIADVIFEHRLYLPSVGACIALTACAFIAAQQSGKGRWLVPVLAGAVIIFSGAAFARNRIWQSEVSLWEDVVRKSPERSRGYHNLGLAYIKNNEMLKALGAYSKAIALDPYEPSAYTNRGIIYYALGQFERALEDHTKTIAFDPGLPNSYVNRGLVYAALRRYGEAVRDYSKAIELDPSSPEAYNNRGNAYDDSGRPGKALADYSTAIALNPYYGSAYYNRGMVQARLGRSGPARSDFEKACSLGNKAGCAALDANPK